MLSPINSSFEVINDNWEWVLLWLGVEPSEQTSWFRNILFLCSIVCLLCLNLSSSAFSSSISHGNCLSCPCLSCMNYCHSNVEFGIIMHQHDFGQSYRSVCGHSGIWVLVLCILRCDTISHHDNVLSESPACEEFQEPSRVRVASRTICGRYSSHLENARKCIIASARVGGGLYHIWLSALRRIDV